MVRRSCDSSPPSPLPFQHGRSVVRHVFTKSQHGGGERSGYPNTSSADTDPTAGPVAIPRRDGKRTRRRMRSPVGDFPAGGRSPNEGTEWRAVREPLSTQFVTPLWCISHLVAGHPRILIQTQKEMIQSQNYRNKLETTKIVLTQSVIGRSAPCSLPRESERSSNSFPKTAAVR